MTLSSKLLNKQRLSHTFKHIYCCTKPAKGIYKAFTMSVQELRDITKSRIRRSKKSPPTNTSRDAKVVKVHDGDTCDLVIIRNGSLERFKCRLLGINSPEMRKGREAEKARDFLAWLSVGEDPTSFPSSTAPWSVAQLQNRLDASNTLVHAEFGGIDYYRRLLVTLKKSSSSVYSFNDLLMQYGYAKKYVYRG